MIRTLRPLPGTCRSDAFDATDGSREDRAKFDHLLKGATCSSRIGARLFGAICLTAEELQREKAGLITPKWFLHGEQGPWSNRLAR